MKDRRIVSLERVLSRRKRLDRTLNVELTAQRREREGLVAALNDAREEAAGKFAELQRQEHKIDAMMSGNAPFRPDDLLRETSFRGVVRERREASQASELRAQAALAAKDEEIRASRERVLKNRARIDIYSKRRVDLLRAIEVAMEDAQDEEASESRRPSPRPF
jgi:Bacterial type III secretion protein (HrpB7)